jgi:murein DD-endopeptidase MepM/ murein hydrolase activator NlpD
MAKPAIAVVAFCCLLVAHATAADTAVVQRAAVSPERGLTGSAEGVRIEFRIASSAPADVAIRIVGSGEEVRRIELPGVRPGVDLVETWDGLSSGGRLVADGTYRVMVGVVGGGEREAGSVTLRGHFFPVRGPHGTRGAVGEFHAPRSGGRRHIGFDVTAACGTPLAAGRTGTVVRSAFDGRLDGNFVVIKGLRERRWYWYSHMARRSPFRKGETVHVGEIVGQVGQTGNARAVGCHLHFELHRRGRPIDPEPDLRAWDRFS